MVSVKPIHPPLPIPLSEPDVFPKAYNYDVLKSITSEYEKGGTSPPLIVGYSWEQYLTFGQFMQEINKKFKEYMILICNYRKDLKEKECENYNK